MADQDDLVTDLSEDIEEKDLPVDNDSGDHEPSEDVMDIDNAMESTIGNVPDRTEPFSIADEVAGDEQDRRDAPDGNENE
jgi:hypothetical protein